MEDMARLALVEQNIKDADTFYELLQELLHFINQILDNPHENELRTIRSDILKGFLRCQPFTDYLKYIGLMLIENKFTYPKQLTLSRLRMSQAAIERKLTLCCGPLKNLRTANSGFPGTKTKRKKQQLVPSFIQVKMNPFLIRIRTLFNDMLRYEDDDLLETAREQIPLVTLQSMAIERMRDRQRRIKLGETKEEDLSFDLALLIELIGWFKFKFFSWVDKPPCENCGGPTQFACHSTMQAETESCTLEVYKCKKCPKGARFPRYNSPATLLRTRRGRCGEWANCFTLLCRALGYDARYVHDVTDHVWCEVSAALVGKTPRRACIKRLMRVDEAKEIFDYDSNTWLHVDPCEGVIDTPLMYTHGWGKSLSYVIAFSRDDIQDVTWRYTTNHSEVLKRRTEVSEAELLDTILALRAHRHAQLSSARRNYLASRTIKELVELMIERKPSDYESRGRLSGSREWREERGEVGRMQAGHTFEFSRVGDHAVRYHAATDVYHVYTNGVETARISKWSNGVHVYHNMFRKVETDWQQAYLARTEGNPTGTIEWRFSATGDGTVFKSLSIKLTSAIYESGCIEWTVQFDGEACIPLELGEVAAVVSRDFASATVRAQLSGGADARAWQHAQLFRQPLDAQQCTFEVLLHLAKK